MNRQGVAAPARGPATVCEAVAATPAPPGASVLDARPRDQVVFRAASPGAPLQHALEEQARRVAHALHDDVGQLLAAMGMSVDNLRRELPVAEARLRAIKDLIALVDLQLRRVVYELRPTILDHLGLVPALLALIDSARQDMGLRVIFDAPVLPHLKTETAIALYRMVQEALTNAARHGLAERVWIRVRATADSIHCTIEDDGRGFDVRAATSAAGGLGLLGMRERITALGGALTVASSPGAGTELRATVPLEVVGCPLPSSSPTTTRSCEPACARSSSATASRS